MTRSIKVGALKLLAGAGLAFSVLGSAQPAHASPSYPPELSKALEQQFPGQTFCVPQCIACHTTNEGGFNTMNVFGFNLETIGRLPPGNPGLVAMGLDTYFKAIPPASAHQVETLFIDGSKRPFFDSDQDGISDYTELQNYDSPSLRLPRGEKEFCPDVTYGCFARVAATPVNRRGWICAAWVVLGLAAYRRLRAARRAG